jgi:hypothetical protein
MPNRFTDSQWITITQQISSRTERYGLPRRRRDSVVIGSFNIRRFGSPLGRSPQALDLITEIASRFDLLAIQEVTDDLSVLRALRARLGPRYGVVVSDAAGVHPEDGGSPERLAFLFRWSRLARDRLSSSR